jgi:hypothetical protein
MKLDALRFITYIFTEILVVSYYVKTQGDLLSLRIHMSGVSLVVQAIMLLAAKFMRYTLHSYSSRIVNTVQSERL